MIYVEDQAFSPSYDVAPPPTSPHPPPFSRTHMKTEKEGQLGEGRGGGVEGGAKSYDGEKA
jgi:hypothetical protein